MGFRIIRKSALGFMIRLFFLKRKWIKNKTRPDTKRRIRNIERGPMQIAPMNIKKVDYFAESNSVDQITQRAAEKKAITRQQA